MTTDRELLELAAKAAGYAIDELHVSGGAWVYPAGELPNANGDYMGLFLWNPRDDDDDGDALRLAVKLRIEPRQVNDMASALWSTDSPAGFAVRNEMYKDDPYAATRRAIVRAAAEIGMGME
jgi:hypothetical protein